MNPKKETRGTPITAGKGHVTLLLLFAVAALFLFVAMTPGETADRMQTDSSATPLDSISMTETPTPQPGEDLEQTNGIILGGVLLVLIIVGGTLSVLRRTSRPLR